MSDTGFPIGFRNCSLGEAITLKRGYDLPYRERRDGSVPIVSSSGVTGQHSIAKVKGPGVVTGRYGTLGEVFYVEEDFWPLNTALYVCDFKGNHPRFIAFRLRTLGLGLQNAAGAVPGVNRNVLHKIPVMMPEQKIQERISDILSAYDNLIDNNNRRIALLKKSVHLLYKEWFIRLRFPGHEEVKVVEGLPEGWHLLTIADLYPTSSGGTPSRKKEDEYYSGGSIPWIKTQELNDRWILDTEEKITTSGLLNSSAKLFPQGTFIVAMYGATIGQFGILAEECATNQACCALLGNPNSLFNYAYAFGYFLSERKKIISMGQGSAQPNISQQVIKKLSILKPPDSILKNYNSIVEPLFQAMLCYQRLNFQLVEARDRLLPRLMNGSIAV